MGVMFLMYGCTLVAVVYIRNALRHRGVAKPGRAKGRVVWEGDTTRPTQQL